MAVNSRTKGATGEREAAKWLAKIFSLQEPPIRNLDQTRDGGRDLIGLKPFAIEVKRCQELKRRAWWTQAQASTGVDEITVVMFRRNREKWRFLIPAKLIGTPGFLEVEWEVFYRWARPLVEGKARDAA